MDGYERFGFYRLIPARAGNIILFSFVFLVDTAHPRSRGEHPITLIELSTKSGSSPLARGTFIANWAWGLVMRLIPARAGNIGLGRVRGGTSAAHPRSRGEHLSRASLALFTAGSSPLARGTWPRLPGRTHYRRLIPARAGNIEKKYTYSTFESAHPRSRGEHASTACRLCPRTGSSPLARGTSRLWHPSAPATRLIPARAGNIRQAITFPVRR